MTSPTAFRNVASSARRGEGAPPAIASKARRDAFPDTRTTAIPEGGRPVESAKMVSGNCICCVAAIALGSIRFGRSAVPLPQANLLAEETSPYLRQHKDNPVHWRPWSSAALAEARDLGRP